MPARLDKEIIAEMTADQALLNATLGKNNAALKTADSRTASAEKLIPPLRRSIENLKALSNSRPEQKAAASSAAAQLFAMLVLLGDERAIARVNAMEKNADPEEVIAYQANQWLQKWYTAGDAEAAQKQVVDELEKLDSAHPESEFLARLTVSLSKEATSPQQADRMMRIVAYQMSNPFATRVKNELAARKEADDQDVQRANKPLTLKGALVDGKAFSTDDLKGKVVLIDFWAVWCAPCRAELPRIKKLYDTYHDKGLEVVGVSNDYDSEVLKSFIAQEGLPWPQLFDEASAAKRQMHPITSAEKINGIPVLYLIDKKGVLRTVNARMTMEELIPKLLAEPG